jgi:hypothetical protein
MDKSKKFLHDSGKIHTGKRQIRDPYNQNIIKEIDEDGLVTRDPLSREITNMASPNDGQMYYEKGFTNNFSNINFNIEKYDDRKYFVRLDNPYDIIAEVWKEGETWMVRDPYHFNMIARVEHPSDALRIGHELLLEAYIKVNPNFAKNRGLIKESIPNKSKPSAKQESGKFNQAASNTFSDTIDSIGFGVGFANQMRREGKSVFKSLQMGLGMFTFRLLIVMFPWIIGITLLSLL